MPDILDILVMVGMFGLRFGVPVLVVVGLGYLLKRLDRRWEAEAQLQAGKAKAEEKQPAAGLPVSPKQAPAPGAELPFIPPPAKEPIRPQIGLGIAPPARPAADVRAGGESKKAACGASQRGDVPCWQARLDAEGQIPEECVNCDVFQRYPLM